jgi:hypothetical protein
MSESPAPTPSSSRPTQSFRRLVRPLAMPIALVAIAAFFVIKEPTYLGSRNLTQL